MLFFREPEAELVGIVPTHIDDRVIRGLLETGILPCGRGIAGGSREGVKILHPGGPDAKEDMADRREALPLMASFGVASLAPGQDERDLIGASAAALARARSAGGSSVSI